MRVDSPAASQQQLLQFLTMPSHLITIAGTDRPGLVESLAQTVSDHGGNWLESRMARLAGQFAGVIRVETPAAKSKALAEALRGLPGLDITVRDAAEGTEAASSGRPVTLEVIGQDRPGIVSQVTRVLAAAGLNIEEFISEVTSAPMSGEPMFRAEAALTAPEGADLSAVRAELEKIAADLMVDISLADE